MPLASQQTGLPPAHSGLRVGSKQSGVQQPGGEQLIGPKGEGQVQQPLLELEEDVLPLEDPQMIDWQLGGMHNGVDPTQMQKQPDELGGGGGGGGEPIPDEPPEDEPPEEEPPEEEPPDELGGGGGGGEPIGGGGGGEPIGGGGGGPIGGGGGAPPPVGH